MKEMVDYKEMYKKMFQASELAINILIAAQRECEEMYISSPESKLIPLDREADKDGNKDRDEE